MKREMLEVVDARPPNFDAIVAVLPDAATPGVMFAFGGKVYFPGGKGPLTRELDAHERVHIERQGLASDLWWNEYLTNPEFRFIEEVIAHGAEYATYCKRHLDQTKRAQFLRRIAQRLVSPLYGADKLPPVCGGWGDTAVERAMSAIQIEAGRF